MRQLVVKFVGHLAFLYFTILYCNIITDLCPNDCRPIPESRYFPCNLLYNTSVQKCSCNNCTMTRQHFVMAQYKKITTKLISKAIVEEINSMHLYPQFALLVHHGDQLSEVVSFGIKNNFPLHFIQLLDQTFLKNLIKADLTSKPLHYQTYELSFFTQ